MLRTPAPQQRDGHRAGKPTRRVPGGIMPQVRLAPKAPPSSALCLLLLGLACARCGGGTRDTRMNTAPAQATTPCKEAAGVRVCGDPGVIEGTTIQSTGKQVV